MPSTDLVSKEGGADELQVISNYGVAMPRLIYGTAWKKERTAAHAKYVGAVLDMIADGRITPVIGRVWAFEQAQEALIAIGKGGTHVGKQVVHISSA